MKSRVCCIFWPLKKVPACNSRNSSATVEPWKQGRAPTGRLPLVPSQWQSAEIARKSSGCEIWVQDFFNLQLPSNYFDGVFANASLFHVPAQLLPKVLLELFNTLKPAGILFSSNPRGTNEEGWNGDRYGAYHDLETWQTFLSAAGFTEVDHFYRPPGLPREQQPWLASVWRK